jgi:hypothetical protein
MYRRLFLLFSGAALLATVPNTAKAQDINAGVWYEFGFGDVGSLGYPCPDLCTQGTNPVPDTPPDAPWTYSSAFGGTFTIVDGFSPGDQFDLLNYGVSQGTTSAPNSDGADCGNDITACLNDPDMSKGTFAFGPGDYSWDIYTDLSPYQAGAGFFRVDEAPEPSTYLLLSTGLSILSLGGVRKRRRAA